MNSNKYILIAEDDSAYRSVLEARLSAEGYALKIVENGSKLIEIINERFPNLIIMDLIMPEMDGFETLKKIKSLPGFTNVPILILSSLGQIEDIEKIKSLGASEYIVKGTINVSELVNRIKNLLTS